MITFFYVIYYPNPLTQPKTKTIPFDQSLPSILHLNLLIVTLPELPEGACVVVVVVENSVGNSSAPIVPTHK